MPAIKRYISVRINKVYLRSKKDKVKFRIFSGKYGLLKPEENIPWYDEKLSDNKISKMTKMLLIQLKNDNIRKVSFFSYRGKTQTKNLYLDTFKSACAGSGIKLEIKYL